MVRPTDFPGVVIDPVRGCVTDEVEISTTPVKTCECFSDCTEPGAPPPVVTECFIYGPFSGNLAKGCPAIIGESFGVSVGSLFPQFIIKHTPAVNPFNLLQAPGALVSNTALRFNLYLGQPITGYEVVLVDNTGKRANATFAPASGLVLEVTLPLASFVPLDTTIDFTIIKNIYFIFSNNAQVALCMEAIDNIRACTNVATPPVFNASVDALPFGDNQPGDSCAMIEDVPNAGAIVRFVCDTTYPPAPAPPPPCDVCFVTSPLVEGTGSVMFRSCAPGAFPPRIAAFFPAPINIVNDVSFSAFSVRAGAGAQFILRDVTGRRAIFNYLMTGGTQLVTIANGGYTSYPDGLPNFTQISEAYWIFGTDVVLGTDVWAVDNFRSNFNTVLQHSFDSLTFLTCGYTDAPTGPGPSPDVCDLSTALSPFTALVRQQYRVTFNGNRSIHTVSRIPSAPLSAPTAFLLKLGFNLATALTPGGVDDIKLWMYDAGGQRRAVASISPLAFVPGVNTFSFPLTGAPAGTYPDQASAGNFNFSEIAYWELAILGVNSNQVPPLTLFFDGFRIEDNTTAVILDENFTGYADLNDFELAGNGGEGCFNDYRMVQFTIPGTALSVQVGGGSEGINAELSQPGYADKPGLFDMGAVAVAPLKTIFTGVDLVKRLGSALVLAAWDRVEIRYQAHVDADGRPMQLMIADGSGFTASFDFLNGAGLLSAGYRNLTVLAASFILDGPFSFADVSKVRLFTQTSNNAPQLNPLLEGQAEDRFDRSEVALSSVDFQDNLSVTISAFDVGAGLTLTDAFGAGGLESGILDNAFPAWDAHVHTYLDVDGGFSADLAPFVPFFNPGSAIVANKFYTELGASMTFNGVFPVPVDVSLTQFVNFWAQSQWGDGRPHFKTVFLTLYSAGGSLAAIPLQNTFYPNLVVNNPGPNFAALPDCGAMEFLLGLGTPIGLWNPLAVTGFSLLAAGGMSVGKMWFQHITGSPFPLPAPETPLLGIPAWTRPLWSSATFTNPANQFTVGKKLDPNSTPVVALNCDLTKRIAYWGQNEDTVRNADIVLVPAKYRNDPVVGENGNYGYDINGDPLPGALENLARDTVSRFGFAAFSIAPFAGCRNIWMDIVYLDAILCLGVYPTKSEYTFFDTECGCQQVNVTQEVADLITDTCLCRILADDGFAATNCPPLPVGYPEAISFEYCALPAVDVTATEDSSPNFTFTRETASCARPEDVPNDTHGHYWVRVSITAKVNPLTVFWQDVLPAGEILVQGSLSGNLVFTGIGQTIIREYMVRTAKLNGATAQIGGSVTGIIPAALPLNLLSQPIDIDLNCDTLEFVRFGSQTPNIFGRVFYYGGGRTDPSIPPDTGIYVKAYMGQGSANISKREQLLVQTTAVPALAVSHDFFVADVQGFAVGLPAWVFNSCFVENPTRKIMCLDIEEEEALADPNEEVVGLYGTVTAIDTATSKITVTFYVPPNQIVNFSVMSKAEIMVAPNNSQGFYWEASPKFVDIVGHVSPAVPPFHAILRWGYRFWNSTQNPAPCAAGAAYICDGDGESRQYELHGDLMKDILNPVDWIDLWCSPVREVPLSADALITQTTMTVCDICLFNPCDIIQLVDSNCTGRESGGPGFVASVVSTAPLNPLEDCVTFHAVKGTISFLPALPNLIVGCGMLDGGFKVNRRARVFKKVDVARFAYSPTTKATGIGTPIDGANFVVVDFETGTFTFDPLIVVKNPCVCYKALNDIIQLPDEEGIYFLVGVDKAGCKSPPSKPIKIVGSGSSPGGGGINQAAKQLAIANVSVGSLTTSGAAPATLPSSSVTFTLDVPSRVKFEVALWQFDVRDAGPGMGDADAFAFLDLRDTGGPTLYPLANRHTENTADPQKVQVGSGSAMIRVLDLPAGTYTFDLAGNAPPDGDNTVFFIAVYPLTFLVWNLGAL